MVSRISEIKYEELHKLLKFLSFFQRLDAMISEEEKRCMLECEEIREFYEELCNTGFLIIFDWKSWLNQNEMYKIIANDIEEPLLKADLDSLRKLMTSYIRGDRFTEGLFEGAILNGHVTKILTRLEVLMEGMSKRKLLHKSNGSGMNG
ncbi:DUF6508 domain-containing protein [Sporosarcina sp. Te-1]|uniref:DUF6508 domain-containing protein n=1 Tax=Sporosarcina sp. Te-1 TaxID=2818390 RepID=UPI001A9D0842|nr:DUF6508 domain-containing protein [Sporosarcina sp. Te-1]QTD41514.1 hypothetical protein J3U78_01225 [Sporosarcina sp. Te-1]